MKKALLAVAGLILAGCSESIPTAPNAVKDPSFAIATAPGQNKLKCFDGTTDGGFGGTCTLPTNGAKGSAILSLTSDNSAGDYAGVYTNDATVYGQLLTDITQLSYQYSGTIIPQAGNLSYNIPIDADGNGTFDFNLFVDAANDGIHCPGVDGFVDIIHNANCVMYAGGVTPYANWAAFVAAYPGAKVTPFTGPDFIFMVAERTPSEPSAVWTVNNVKFGKGGRGK